MQNARLTPTKRKVNGAKRKTQCYILRIRQHFMVVETTKKMRLLQVKTTKESSILAIKTRFRTMKNREQSSK